MNQVSLRQYAQLIVKTGVNIGEGQTLVIGSPIECAPITRLIAETAYDAGAREVIVNWKDEQLSKIRFIKGADEIFDEFPSWQHDLYMTNVRKGAAFISIAASDPELMKDVDPDRMIRSHKAGSQALREYYERMMSNQNAWCVISVPTAAWAGKVFPELAEEAAVEALWDAIFKAVRADQPDPVAAWNDHKALLKKNIDILNNSRFQSLQFRNSLGTDLTIELPEGHIWSGGSDATPEGREFIANMPTEEIYTLPKKTGVQGKVVSSMPLNYNGSLIQGFSLTFKDGCVEAFTAEKGYEILKRLLDSDEGARYLGEVALVPYDSPISNTGILFYNTLFDENASCHLALGKAYPSSLQDGDKMTKEALSVAGVNDSLIHEDFMIGTADLEIDGITADGQRIAVFRNGNFAF